jgi:hypothetical protein
MQGTATVFDEIRLATSLAAVTPSAAPQAAAPQSVSLSTPEESTLQAAYASAESTLLGTVSSGSLTNLWNSDNVCETLQESLSGDTSALDHIWTLEVAPGSLTIFYVEAAHTANAEGDDFLFWYSTDGVNYTEMVTETRTADNNSLLGYTLPTEVSGTVYVRVTDSDRTAGRTGLDTLSIDHLFITSE